jgi:hypothetical protein
MAGSLKLSLVLVGLFVVAAAAFLVGTEIASAHTTGADHWHVWNDYAGCAYRTLYYPSGGSTGISQFLMC